MLPNIFNLYIPKTCSISRFPRFFHLNHLPPGFTKEGSYSISERPSKNDCSLRSRDVHVFMCCFDHPGKNEPISPQSQIPLERLQAEAPKQQFPRKSFQVKVRKRKFPSECYPAKVSRWTSQSQISQANVSKRMVPNERFKSKDGKRTFSSKIS